MIDITIIEHQQISLDSFCTKSNVYPYLIKMDIKGAKYKALEDAKSIMTEHRPTVFLNKHPKELTLQDSSVEELLQLIESYQYSCFNMKMEHPSYFKLEEYILLPTEQLKDDV